MHDFAPREKRFFAFLIDIVPISLIIFLIYYFFLGFDETINNYLNIKDNVAMRIKFLEERNLIREVSFLVWIFYCAILESSQMQGTFGKFFMKIKVIDENGQSLTPMLSLKRNTSKILSYLILSAGFIWLLFDPQRQGWHDKIAKTFVVNMK